MRDEQRVAVVGCGVAGLTAAHILQREHQVTIFERNDYLGGHTHTVAVPDGPDAGTGVDTGFIVCNDHTYPLFHKLLDQLGVQVRASNMSFSYTDRSKPFFYAGTGLNGLFAQRMNLCRPSFWRMLGDIRTFCREGAGALERGCPPGGTIAEYVEENGLGKQFVDWYLVPMMAAIWSTTPGEVMAFPAEALLRFFRNHGLLSLKDRPTWQTVVGGSHAYVDAFEEQFGGTIRAATPVKSILRTEEDVEIGLEGGDVERFDQVVVAAHADQALSLLGDPDEEERKLLGAWQYERNHTVLHSDSTALPPVRRAWASWNYEREDTDEKGKPVSVTYHMNRLQGLQTCEEYCVSLNRRTPLREDSIVAEIDYMHPTFSFASMDTQASLPSLNGRRHTYFCGSYFGYGFHEDAVRSGVKVGEAFGIAL